MLTSALGGAATVALWREPAHAQPTSGAGNSASGPVEILAEESSHGGPRVLVQPGGSWTLLLEDLAPRTEHTVRFRLKSAGTTSFRLSGFKNPEILDYHDGTGDLSSWETAPEGRDNLLNWLEHLAIGRDEWLEFRYDFTTGEADPSTARAVFTVADGPVEIDGVGIVVRSSLGEDPAPLPAIDELSRGHRLLLDHGFQFMTWMPTEEASAQRAWMVQPTPEDFAEIGYTGAQFNDAPNYSPEFLVESAGIDNPITWASAFGPYARHLSSTYQDLDHVDGRRLTGSPTPEIREAGFLDEHNGLADLESLAAMCIGDEENWSDTLVQNLKSWFEVVRTRYPDVLAYHNEVGTTPRPGMAPISTFGRDQLAKYLSVARPDLLSFDMYYFRERRVGQTVGGTTLGLIGDLNRYRLAAAAGHDGTGRQPIPWGHYTYAWRTGPGAATDLRRGDGWYELTESQIHLYSFAALTFGAKLLSNFRWIHDAPAYLFTDYRVSPDGASERYRHFDWFRNTIAQTKAVAPHLLRLQNTQVAVVLGRHLDSEGRTVANAADPDTPVLDTVLGSEAAQQIFLTGISATNPGGANDGLEGDVFVGFFDPLTGLSEEDRSVFTSTDPRYFMVLNGMTAGDGLPAEMQQGSSFETRQTVALEFQLPEASTASRLRRVSRIDGGIAEVPLRSLGSGRYELSTDLGGGLGDLFFWELGGARSSVSEPTEEASDDPRLVGDPALSTPLPQRDLGGRTVRIGVVAGAQSPAPRPQIGRNPGLPPESEIHDGRTLTLTRGGDIGAIGERYYTQDIWEFRLERIQRDGHCTIEIVELEHDVAQLVEEIRSGALAVDAVVVPDTWLWDHAENLLDAEALRAWDEVGTVDLDEDKWKRPALDLATTAGATWGLAQDHTTDFLALFVHRARLRALGVTRDLGGAQRSGGTVLADLLQIADAVPEGTPLLADTDDFFRQLLISCGVETRWEGLEGEPLRRAMETYEHLRGRGVLVRVEDADEAEAMFGRGEIAMMVRPYRSIEAYRHPYFVYHDNTERAVREIADWGVQTMTWPKDEEWTVTAEARPGGEHPLAPDDVAVLLFPTPTREDPARQAIVGQSLMVLPRSTPRPDEVGFVVDEMLQHYRGVWNLEFTRREPWRERMTATRDLDTVRKAGLRDSYGDALAASGDWQAAALADLLRLYHEDPRLTAFLDDPTLARATSGITRTLLHLRTLQEDGAITPNRASQLEQRLEKAQSSAITWRGGEESAREKVEHFLDQAQRLVHRHGADWWGTSPADLRTLRDLVTAAVEAW
ncbi:hypothetical protein CFK38_01930 [Brachybacterium vulturis]|uniref:Uncharacterized protein n=1 Tax=Brachybacterium vulturis TaxID=2017484 RepID=A0A291GK23_9MICO|nr:hypothetical protein CFK38_01930 [Brachybacterium vulturis]